MQKDLDGEFHCAFARRELSPFEKGQEPKPFPVRECVTLEELAEMPDAAFAPVIVGLKGSQDAPRLRLTPAEGVPGVVVTVLDAGGKRLAGPWYADLYWPGKVRHADLVDLGDGRCRYVQASMVYGEGETAADGRRHNYWVHTLLGFGKDGRAVVEDAADQRFPAWIWYTEKPNHRPTRLLTQKQKRRLWAREPRVFGARDRGDAYARPDSVAGATRACKDIVEPRVHHPTDRWPARSRCVRTSAVRRPRECPG